MGNLTGNVFDQEVIKQIESRQTFLGARNKTDANLIYSNNSTSFLRLASSVNVESPQLRERNLSENLKGDLLSKSCVLFGGVVGVDNKLNPKYKFGIVNNSTNNFDYVSTIAAYGWGGIDKGFTPMPSIESADVGFHNRGAIAKASVKIKVYSLQQLQIFDLLYFRIGYSMLLEWGHNIWLDHNLDLNTNPNPIKLRTKFVTKPFEKFFAAGSTQQDIIKSIHEQRKDDNYNYDAMLGKVTNFTWTFNDDGTYDIELKLVGLGDIIESLKINKSNIITNNVKDSQLSLTKEQLEKIEKEKQATEDAKSALGEGANAVDAALLLKTKIQTANARIKVLQDQIRASFPAGGLPFSAFNYYLNEVKLFEELTLTDDETPNKTVYKKLQQINITSTATATGSALAKLKELKKYDGHITATDLGAENAANEQNKLEQQRLNNRIDALNLKQQKLNENLEALSLAPETSIETKNKTALNLQLYEWRILIENKGNSKNFYKLQLSTAPTDSRGKLPLNFFYVRLGYLLDWIEKNLLLYDTNKPFTSVPSDTEPVKPPQPIPDEDYTTISPPPGNPMFQIDTDSETNFCLRFPAQFSSDPKVCIIPSKYNKDSISWNILPDLKAYFVDDNEYAGKLMNLFVNIDYTARALDLNTDANGKSNLFKFLSSLLNGINDALGNVNKIEPIFDAEENKLKLIEGSSLEKVEELVKNNEKSKEIKMGVFQVYGIGTDTSPQGSFITNVNFQVQLPPNMAAMATISAQAGGNIVGENATGLSKLNTGLTDRIMTFKLDKDSIEGTRTGKLDPTKIFNTNIQAVKKFVDELYVAGIYSKDTVDSTKSSNRDVALYLTGNDALEGLMPPPFFIPFNLSLNMNGISGMKNYERFSITEKVLPYSYRTGNQGGVIDFLIKGISHTISNNKWETKIESLSVGSNRRIK
jgi:hypothetical protein